MTIIGASMICVTIVLEHSFHFLRRNFIRNGVRVQDFGLILVLGLVGYCWWRAEVFVTAIRSTLGGDGGVGGYTIISGAVDSVDCTLGDVAGASSWCAGSIVGGIMKWSCAEWLRSLAIIWRSFGFSLPCFNSGMVCGVGLERTETMSDAAWQRSYSVLVSEILTLFGNNWIASTMRSRPVSGM